MLGCKANLIRLKLPCKSVGCMRCLAHRPSKVGLSSCTLWLPGKNDGSAYDCKKMPPCPFGWGIAQVESRLVASGRKPRSPHQLQPSSRAEVFNPDQNSPGQQQCRRGCWIDWVKMEKKLPGRSDKGGMEGFLCLRQSFSSLFPHIAPASYPFGSTSQHFAAPPRVDHSLILLVLLSPRQRRGKNNHKPCF